MSFRFDDASVRVQVPMRLSRGHGVELFAYTPSPARPLHVCAGSKPSAPRCSVHRASALWVQVDWMLPGAPVGALPAVPPGAADPGAMDDAMADASAAASWSSAFF